MRKLAIAMALTSTAIASPALARDDAWYIGVEAGPSIVEDINFDVNALSNAITVDHDTGYDVDGIIGYDFGGFRLEAEVAYKEAGVNNITSTTTVPTRNAAGAVVNQAAGIYNYAGGQTNVLSFMMNGMLDFGDDDGINGFVGGGVGVARVPTQAVWATVRCPHAQAGQTHRHHAAVVDLAGAVHTPSGDSGQPVQAAQDCGCCAWCGAWVLPVLMTLLPPPPPAVSQFDALSAPVYSSRVSERPERPNWRV